MNCPRCGRHLDPRHSYRSFCEVCGVALAPSKRRLLWGRWVVAVPLVVFMVIALLVFRGAPGKRTDETAFPQCLLGRWESADGGIVITFERTTAVLQEGKTGGEAEYEVDSERKLVRFHMPDPQVSVTARMGEDGSLRVQSSTRPGELVVLKHTGRTRR